jgi:serine/threonine protein kinase
MNREVLLGEWHGKNVALKTLTSESENLNLFVEEVSFARKLNSPRFLFIYAFIYLCVYLFPSVVRVFGVCLVENSIFAVLEHCENGSLLDYLHANKGKEKKQNNKP